MLVNKLHKPYTETAAIKLPIDKQDSTYRQHRLSSFHRNHLNQAEEPAYTAAGC